MMVLMMIVMVVFIVAGPGHMGTHASRDAQPPGQTQQQPEPPRE